MAALLHALEKTTALGARPSPAAFNPMTDLTTRFDYANAAPDYLPAGGGQEWPRSCTRWKKQRRSGARPSPAASTRRPILRPVSIMQILRPIIHRLGAAKNGRAPAKPRKNPTAVRSAAVPGRINATADRARASITRTRRPIFDRLGAAKNGRAPARGGKGNGAGSAAVPGRINTTADLTPVSIMQILRPIIHRLGAAKNRRAPAKPRKNPTAPGARPSPAASTRRPILRLVSITQIRQPGVHENLKSTCLA